MKNIFQELFQIWNPSTMLWLYDHIIRSSFHLRNKNENEIAYEHKTNTKNLNEQNLSFPNTAKP